MGKKAPKTPDPYAVADAQSQMNKETAEYNASLNRIDQSNPYSSVKYTQSGTDPNTGAPIYSQSTTFSPQLQSLFDSQMSTQQGIADATTGMLGMLPTEAFDPSSVGDTSHIAQTSYDRQLAQLTPGFEEGARNLQGTMSDRGIPIGSEVWNNEQNRYDTAKNSALSQASRTAQLDATNEQQRLLQNAVQQYGMPYDQLSKLMGNSQAASTGSQTPFAQSNSANTDLASGVWSAYKADAANAQNSNNQLMSGLLGIGSMAMNPASAFGYKLW